MKKMLAALILTALAACAAHAAMITLGPADLHVTRASASAYPQMRQLAGSTGGEALVWGSTVADNNGASATVTVPAEKAPAGEYTLWLRQSYSDPNAISGFTGLQVDVNGKVFARISGPLGQLYYTTSLEKFYWTPVVIGQFGGGALTITRDASGGGFVGLDQMVLSDDANWQPEGYVALGKYPKTIAAFAGPPISLPGQAKAQAPADFIKVEAEQMTIDRAGADGYPYVEGDVDRWGLASGGKIVSFNCVVDETEARKSLSHDFGQLPGGKWRLWVRLGHGLPQKDIDLGCPLPTQDTGVYVQAGGKTYGPILHPSTTKQWNDLIWWSVDLPADFRGGPVKIVRKTGGGWVFMDVVILTSRQDYQPA